MERRSARALAAAGCLVLGLTVAAHAQSGGTQPTSGAAPAPDPVAGLTLRQLVGQRFVYSYFGINPPPLLQARIARGEVGGVILFAANIGTRAHLRSVMARLQAIRRPPGLQAPLLVMIDQEGGLVKRLAGAPLRSPALLGRIGSVALARSEGLATARNLRDVGVNVNLAPVVDVGRPGSFQQRTFRSYSSDPRRVSAMSTAFVSGLQQGGVAATLKHFPGLGTIRADEDALAQRVFLSLFTLRRLDESPFAAGVGAGVSMVMTSTAIYPAMSPRPALLSPRITTGELRGYVRFPGVSITDDLTVSALARFGTLERLGITAAQAGNDLLLYCGGYFSASRAYEAVVRAAAANQISPLAMRASVRRVLALRAALAG